jgi:hypothetical protein
MPVAEVEGLVQVVEVRPAALDLLQVLEVGGVHRQQVIAVDAVLHVEQGRLVVEELGDGTDEPAVAHADVAVARPRPVNGRRCQSAKDHEDTSQDKASADLPVARRGR